MKIITLIGTRPEIIKLAQTIKELDIHVDHKLVHTGQNYDFELNEIFFRDLEIRGPDYFLNAAASTPAQAIANVIARFDEVLETERPDAVLIYGDTNSCLGIIAAKRRKIPIFHMEAGNRCFDLRVPEEINRTIVDHLADINFVLTEHSRRYLEREGIRPETIIKTGSSLPEVFAKYRDKIEASTVLLEYSLRKGRYFVVSLHREEMVDDTDMLKVLLESLNALAKKYALPVIFSVHPRTRCRLEDAGVALEVNIVMSKPFGFFDYIALQKNALCVLSDSGTITEESSLLGFPAVILRKTHERPEGNDTGATMLVGYDRQSILRAAGITISQFKNGFVPRIVEDYNNIDVSKVIVRNIIGYTGYVNEFIWHKNRFPHNV